MGFWARREGHLFLAGLGLWAIILGEVALWFAYDPDLAKRILLFMGAEIFTGREPGISVATSQGIAKWIIFHISALQDIASALLMYPFFLWALHEYRDHDNYLMRRLRQIEEKAQGNQKYVKRWGPTGIALFMLIPFLINGPMVGMVLGRLSGLRTRQVLPPVIVATVIAAAAWTYFFDILFDLTGRVDGRIGVWISIAMVTVVVLLAAWDWWRERNSGSETE